MDEISQNGKERIYRILVRVAQSDGEVDPSELAALERLRAELDFDRSEADRIEGEAPEAQLRIGKSAAEKAFLARGMVLVAAADGVLHPQEERLLMKTARAVGLSKENMRTALVAALARATTSQPEAKEPAEREPLSKASSEERGSVVVFFSGPAPAGVDGPATLAEVVKATREAQRFAEVSIAEEPTPGLEAIEVRATDMSTMYGPGHDLVVRLLSAAGAELESYTLIVIGPGDGVPSAAGGLACGFADPADYPELQRRRGKSGDLRHPALQSVDPQLARGDALAACCNADPVGLKNMGERCLQVAKHTLDVEDLLFASELFELAGEHERARRILSEGLADFDAARIVERFSRLRALREIGLEEFARLTLWLGSATSPRIDLFRILSVLRYLGSPCDDSLVPGKRELLELVVNPVALHQLMGSFGVLPSKLCMVGMLLNELVQGNQLLEPGQVVALVHEVRPYLQPVLGKKSFWHLLEQLEAPDHGAAFAKKILKHVETKGYLGDSVLRQAESDQASDNLAEALAGFLQLTEAHPQAWHYWHGLARVQIEMEFWQPALESLDQAVSLAPDQVRPRLLRASLYLMGHGGQVKSSLLLDDYGHVLTVDPFHALAHSALGNLLCKLGAMEEGIAELLEGIRLLPEPGSRYDLGTSLLQAGPEWTERALQEFDQVLEEVRDYPEAWINRGICKFRLERYGGAIRDFDQGLVLAPHYVFALGYRGLAKEAIGEAGALHDLGRYLRECRDAPMEAEAQAALKRLRQS